MQVVHDRRPPGLDRVIGAAGANAGLIHGADGWRAVVLPSLGDIAADLGEGPVAIRADGRRIAVAVDGAIEEHDIGTEGAAARHDGAAGALCYCGLGRSGRGRGFPRRARRAPPPATDLPSSSCARPRAAPRVAARHADGAVSLWEPGAAEPLAMWPAPVADAGAIALSAPTARWWPSGAPTAPTRRPACATPSTGAQVRRVDGARLIALAPEPGALLVAGDWGCAWMKPLEEDS